MTPLKLLDLFCGAGGASIERRFWSHVAISTPDACWLWTSALRPNGYGQMSIKSHPFKAHRLSFLIANGWLPEVVMHRCDNPPCVNPAHLVGGTQRDNLRDAARKGRARGTSRLGSTNPASKLTEADVRKIRELHDSGASTRGLARRFGVDAQTMRRAVRGQSWTHVERTPE